MWIGHNISSCIVELSRGIINYNVDVLVRCNYDGADDGTAPAIIRPARRPLIGIITDCAILSSVLSSFSMTTVGVRFYISRGSVIVAGEINPPTPENSHCDPRWPFAIPVWYLSGKKWQYGFKQN